ncbi:tRNA-(ms[2]io[6]A)-hydroxylase [Myxococcota bacterium]|nr:tRNA-(ms[2]io[6]A)-hydroxylase [Myxococcota bacterium]
MLSLARVTDSAWLPQAVERLDEILVDHAHCEKKAAGMAVQLIFRYTQHSFLHEPLSRLAREELAHFEQVLEHLRRRGVEFRALRPGPYAGRLKQAVRGTEPERLLDTLLCSALIEARSCERFGLLAEGVPDPKLAAFYQSLLASEARHHRIYVDLAKRLAPDARVRARLDELAAIEASALSESGERVRMHS